MDINNKKIARIKNIYTVDAVFSLSVDILRKETHEKQNKQSFVNIVTKLVKQKADKASSDTIVFTFYFYFLCVISD